MEPYEPLDNVRIASPCSAKWGEMSGDHKVRFCSLCGLNVYNLSALKKKEAEELIGKTEGRLCVRFFRRRDGSMLTSDCPIGLRAVRLKLARLAGTMAAFLAAAGGGFWGKMLTGVFSRSSAPEQVESSLRRAFLGEMVMGGIAAPPKG